MSELEDRVRLRAIIETQKDRITSMADELHTQVGLNAKYQGQDEVNLDLIRQAKELRSFFDTVTEAASDAMEGNYPSAGTLAGATFALMDYHDMHTLHIRKTDHVAIIEYSKDGEPKTITSGDLRSALDCMFRDIG